MQPFKLGEDIDLLRESVHAFAEKEIAPRAGRTRNRSFGALKPIPGSPLRGAPE